MFADSASSPPTLSCTKFISRARLSWPWADKAAAVPRYLWPQLPLQIPWVWNFSPGVPNQQALLDLIEVCPISSQSHKIHFLAACYINYREFRISLAIHAHGQALESLSIISWISAFLTPKWPPSVIWKYWPWKQTSMADKNYPACLWVWFPGAIHLWGAVISCWGECSWQHHNACWVAPSVPQEFEDSRSNSGVYHQLR